MAPNVAKVIPRILDELGFYSKALEEAQRLPMPKGTGEQFHQMLLKQGVKPDELKWTGADNLLKDRDSIASQELVDYLQKNRVKLGEREYSQRAADKFEESGTFEDALNAARDKQVEKLERYNESPGAFIDEIDPDDVDDGRVFGVYRDGVLDDRYATMEEATAAREKLQEELWDEHADNINSMINQNEARRGAYSDLGMTEDGLQPKFDGGWQTKGGRDYREILMKNESPPPEIPGTGGQRPHVNDFETGHFPDDPNIVAHMRVKNYKTPKGEGVTLADETQSDWAQKGRDKGFNQPLDEADLRSKRNRVSDLQKSAWLKNTDGKFISALQFQEALKAGRVDNTKEWDKTIAAVNAHPDAQEARLLDIEIQNAVRASKGAVPDGPFVDNTSKWTDLAVKRGLTEAARDGSDFFAWPHGADVADRYNMRKFIDQIKYRKVEEPRGWHVFDDTGSPIADTDSEQRAHTIAGGRAGYTVQPDPEPTYELNVFKKGSDSPSSHFVRDSELNAQVGKALADKIRADAGDGPTVPFGGVSADDLEKKLRDNKIFKDMSDEHYDKWVKTTVSNARDSESKYKMKSIAGDNFPVGGEGHVAYYDQIMPKRVQEVMRKHVAPAEVEPVDLVSGTEQIFGKEAEAIQYQVAKELGFDPPSPDNLVEFERWWRGLSPEDSKKIHQAYRPRVSRNSAVRAQGVRLTPEMRDKILKSGFPLFVIAGLMGISPAELQDELDAAGAPEPQLYGRGGLVKKGLEEVAEAWSHKPTINVGLNVNDGSVLSPDDVLRALEGTGVKVTKHGVTQSATEPTFVGHLNRSLTPEEAHKISEQLRQEAIAQVDHTGKGDLFGPDAEKWKPFSREYFREMPDATVRDDVVHGTEMKGDGRKFKDFFSDVTSGKSDKYKPRGLENYDPAIELGPDAAAFRALRDRFSGRFDNHIKTSIPGFDEVQNAVGSSLLKTYGKSGGDILDIGTSEGALIKALSDASGGSIRTHGIDPNPDMIRTFNEMPQVRGSTSELAAYGSREDAGKLAWEEGDTPIKFFDENGNRYDAAHEAMVYQFISNSRGPQVQRMKQLLKPKGIAILEEKFGGPKHQYDLNEAKKDRYKGKYYTQDQLEAKRREVLQTGGDAVEGMTDLQVSQAEMENIMRENFRHRAQFWDSGNFKGYVGSDDNKSLEDFLNNLQSLQSEYSTGKTPRGFRDGGEVKEY